MEAPRRAGGVRMSTGRTIVQINGPLGQIAPTSLAAAAVGLKTTQQRDMAAIIEREFYAAGFSPRMAAAAIANAWHESSLNPAAAGDAGQSIGLFQLYSKGAGAGMSVEARKDPVTNTRRIIEVVKGGGAVALRQAEAAGADAAELARLFCIYVERPKDSATKGLQRAATARSMFPGTLPASAPPLAAVAGYGLLTAGVGAALLIGGALYLRSRSSR